MAAYPIRFDVARPERFERSQVALRIVLLVALSIVASAAGVFVLLYLVFPIIAAVVVGQKGGQRYLDEDGPRMTAALRWVVGAIAYLSLVSDRLPTDDSESFQLGVERSGSPTVGSALLRIVYGIPSAIVLGFIGLLASLIWLVSVIWVLVSETYPESFWRFQRAVVRWEARLLGYLTSLVDAYPPFSIDMDGEEPAAEEPAAEEPATGSAPGS